MATSEEVPTTSREETSAAGESEPIVLVIAGSIAPADVAGLCEHVRRLLEVGDAPFIVCEVGALVDPDAGTVNALARMQLTARRLGRQIRLRHASPELEELVDLVGLCRYMPRYGDLRAQSPGQAEEGEQSSGVEEEVEPTDPVT